eukprot:3185429-Rhodomonas_salina.1
MNSIPILATTGSSCETAHREESSKQKSMMPMLLCGGWLMLSKCPPNSRGPLPPFQEERPSARFGSSWRRVVGVRTHAGSEPGIFLLF